MFLIFLLPWWCFLCFPSPCSAFSSILICWGFFKLLLNLLFHVLCSMFSSISPLHVDCYVPLSPYLMYTGFNFLIRNILKLWFLSQKKQRFLSQQVRFFWLIVWVFLILLLPWWRFLCFPSPCSAFFSILICWGFFKLLLNLLFRVLCYAFSSISPLHVDCYVPLSPYLMYTGFNFLVFLIFIGP